MDAVARARKRHFDSEGFARPRDVAAYLGVGKMWVYELIRTGALTHIRHGKRISIPWKAVYEYAALRIKPGRIA